MTGLIAFDGGAAADNGLKWAYPVEPPTTGASTNVTMPNSLRIASP
jgi:hypothetical protein